MTQHAALAPERWARFEPGQQILQIAVELQRALKYLRPERQTELRSCYERALQLVDLTIQVSSSEELRRELGTWRRGVADLMLRDEPDAETHRRALRDLLGLHPESAKQIAVLGL